MLTLLLAHSGEYWNWLHKYFNSLFGQLQHAQKLPSIGRVSIHVRQHERGWYFTLLENPLHEPKLARLCYLVSVYFYANNVPTIPRTTSPYGSFWNDSTKLLMCYIGLSLFASLIKLSLILYAQVMTFILLFKSQ